MLATTVRDKEARKESEGGARAFLQVTGTSELQPHDRSRQTACLSQNVAKMVMAE